MEGHDLDIDVVYTTVLLDVFDPRVREVDMPVEVGELVVGGPSLDLGRRPIRTAITIAATAVPLLQEPLILALELVSTTRSTQFQSSADRRPLSR